MNYDNSSRILVEKNGVQFWAFKTHNLDDIEFCHRRLLEMASAIADILDANGYKYCMSYGTLLGAIRHEGFIPWDEDFDINLFEDEYDDAIECLRQNLPSNFILQDKKSDPIYWPEWAKVRDTSTEAFAIHYSDDNYYRWSGLNVDLYKYEKIKAKDILVWKKKKAIQYLIRKHDSKVMNDELFNRLFDEWTYEYARLVEDAKVGDESLVYAMIDTSKKATFRIEDFQPLKKLKFEGMEFWAPNNAEGVLEAFYGDYMALPPLEKREAAYIEVKGRL